jgi:RNA polymerase sigma-32 factor
MEPSLPSANSGNNLWRYIRETHKFPLLSAEVEQMLCHPWRDHHDISAAHQLARSHLRLVVKIAMRYRGYGLPAEELIGEGHVGLMRAVCRFDPDRGIRFSTYAIWWVRAAIQEYILHNCSLVKMGTTAAQKKLFFNLRRMRDHSREFDKGTLRPEHAAGIANVLRVPAHEVITMSQRMAGPDRSLNAPPGAMVKANGRVGWWTIATVRKPNWRSAKRLHSRKHYCRLHGANLRCGNAISSLSVGSENARRPWRTCRNTTASRASGFGGSRHGQ